jgi:protein-disulfide isomerase
MAMAYLTVFKNPRNRRATMAVLRAPLTSDDHVRGSVNAPITLVEYGDYECPQCGLAHPIVRRVRKHFGKNLRFVFRHFPLSQIHLLAEPAAETAEFAGADGRFWEMHDALYENQAQLSMPLLFALAGALSLPVDALKDALETQQFFVKVRNDFLGGVRSGVNGTPTFFINNSRHDGPFDFDDLVSAIEMHILPSTPLAFQATRT